MKNRRQRAIPLLTTESKACNTNGISQAFWALLLILKTSHDIMGLTSILSSNSTLKEAFKKEKILQTCRPNSLLAGFNLASKLEG